ncbi:serine/threonine protein kinase [Myxococcota bacterium]|nr:serine/threonine protein kinase [Myxococcota bacterium]
MKCARCDHDYPDTDRFCGRCGLARTTDGSSVDPLVGLVIAGRYTIERRIGVGGMGTVYLGTHHALGHRVAVKVLHERFNRDTQLKQRFENEARTYSKLSHPNLVQLHDSGTAADGTLFMVMEYCPGTMLSVLVRERKTLPCKLGVDIVTQVAQGLTAAHNAGFVHRDLKPDNVMLMESRPGKYHVKLLDFGIAKNLDEEYPTLTQAGMVFGTPEYMSPEQARGERVDERTDIYALGTILYELLTGKPPFTGTNKMNVMHRQASEPPTPPSALMDVPLAVEAVVLRCLEKSAEDRFPNAVALIEALEAALGIEAPNAPPLPPPPKEQPTKTPTIHNGQVSARFTPPPVRTPAPRHWLGVGVVAGVFTAAVGAAMVFGGGEPDVEPPPAPAVGGPLAPPSVAAPAPATVTPLSPVSAAPEIAPRPAPKSAPAVKPPPKAPAPPAMTQKARKTAFADARKFLRSGQFDEADRRATRLLEVFPGDAEYKGFRDQVRKTREALAKGRKAFDRDDCVTALRLLGPVVEVAPGAQGASHIVNTCRNALPPKEL